MKNNHLEPVQYLNMRGEMLNRLLMCIWRKDSFVLYPSNLYLYIYLPAVLFHGQMIPILENGLTGEEDFGYTTIKGTHQYH